METLHEAYVQDLGQVRVFLFCPIYMKRQVIVLTSIKDVRSSTNFRIQEKEVYVYSYSLRPHVSVVNAIEFFTASDAMG